MEEEGFDLAASGRIMFSLYRGQLFWMQSLHKFGMLEIGPTACYRERTRV